MVSISMHYRLGGPHIKWPLSMWSPLAHSHFLFFLYIYILSLSLSSFSWTFMCPILLFLSFFYGPSCVQLFFSKVEPAPSLVRMAPVAGCLPISPTLGLLCLTTPKAKCVMSVSLSVSHQLGVPSVQSVWFSYSQAPYVPCSFNPNLEMVSDKNTRRCILTREHVLSFYWFSIKFFLLFFKSSGYLPVVLVYGHKLDHGRFSSCSHDW